jgi:Tol biopolymer transport system component
MTSHSARILRRHPLLRSRTLLDALEPRLLLSTSLLSVDTSGNAAAGSAGLLLPANASNFSPDGRFVLFTSQSTSLVAGITDSANTADLFIRDLQTGTTSILSADSTGHAVGSSALSSLVFSPDSRYLVFKTASPNMVAGIADTNGLADLFIRDLLAGTTSAVTINAAGTSTGNASALTDTPVFTADSRYLAFVSQATDLVTGITDTTAQDVFVRDLQTNTTTLISINPAGTSSGLNISQGPLVSSPDGRFLAFDSLSSGLVTGFTGFNGSDNLFVRDRQTNTTFLVTRNTLGQATNWAPSANPFSYQFSPDSHTLYYTSGGANMVAGVADTNQNLDIFAWNSQNDSISMLSVTPDGASAGDHASIPAGLSPDGRFLAFSSASTNLTAQSAGGDIKADLYVRDLQTGTTTYVALNATASVAFPQPIFSPDSVNLLFESDATNVVPGITDTNGLTDLFLYNMVTGVTSAAALNIAGTATANAQSFGARSPSFSPDGRYLAFTSDATDLAPGVSSNHLMQNLFVRDLQTGSAALVTAGFNNTDAGYNPSVFQALFTPNSDFLVFTDNGLIANPLTTPLTFNFKVNGYIFNLTTHTNTLLDPNSAGTGMSNGAVSAIAIDPATGAVLFTSNSSDLIAGINDIASNQPSADDAFLTTLPTAAGTGSSHATLFGLGQNITDGDSSPTTTDGTDFGATPPGTPIIRIFTVFNNGDGDLTTSGLTVPAGFSILEGLSATLAPGANDTITIQFDAAAGTSSGDVTFNTNDPSAATFSFAITANGSVGGGGGGGPADLTIEGGVTSVKAGNFIGGKKGGKAAVKVFNRGTAAASGPLKVVFYASLDTTLDGGDTPVLTLTKKINLKINKSIIFSGSFNYPTGIADGQYFILANVDDNNAFAESNESNNVAASPAAIGIAPPVFDLSGTALAPSGKLTSGKTGKVSLTLLNTGNVAATGSHVSFQLVFSADDTLGNGDDQTVVITVVKKLSINPGASKKITLNAALAGVLPGPYHLFTLIDSTNAMTESNEGNNTFESPTLATVL